MIIAIDGPAGAGKSTVARALADRIGAAYLDTGAMYRALTWLALRDGLDPADGAALGDLARARPITLAPEGDTLTVAIDGTDVTSAIRAEEITATVSQVSAHPAVREAVVAAQRRILATGDWVADGRDIGTVVAPAAALKVFLTASVAERARRRHGDLVASGAAVDPVRVENDLRRRDEIDSTRATSPLRPADDAVLVDTTDLTREQVVDRLERLVERARGG
jgi:cytidylate kinase